MTLQKRLKRIMRRHEWRVADLARWFGVPYTTCREWVLHGRVPAHLPQHIERMLVRWEKG